MPTKIKRPQCCKSALRGIFSSRVAERITVELAVIGINHTGELKGKRIPATFATDMRFANEAQMARFNNWLTSHRAVLVN